MIVQTKQRKKMLAYGAVSMIALIFAFIAAPASASENNAEAVLAANTQFYAALNKMFVGEIAPMTEIWSHADDVTYMGPTGRFDHGWSAVLKDWEGQAARKLGGKVEPAEIHLLAGQGIAIVNDYEQGENVGANGKVERLKLRATNIFRKEDARWKMVGHHTDPLPYLSK